MAVPYEPVWRTAGVMSGGIQMSGQDQPVHHTRQDTGSLVDKVL